MPAAVKEEALVPVRTQVGTRVTPGVGLVSGSGRTGAALDNPGSAMDKRYSAAAVAGASVLMAEQCH